jgi:hypothetical protein
MLYPTSGQAAASGFHSYLMGQRFDGPKLHQNRMNGCEVLVKIHAWVCGGGVNFTVRYKVLKLPYRCTTKAVEGVFEAITKIEGLRLESNNNQSLCYCKFT